MSAAVPDSLHTWPFRVNHLRAEAYFFCGRPNLAWRFAKAWLANATSVLTDSDRANHIGSAHTATKPVLRFPQQRSEDVFAYPNLQGPNRVFIYSRARWTRQSDFGRRNPKGGPSAPDLLDAPQGLHSLSFKGSLSHDQGLVDPGQQSPRNPTAARAQSKREREDTQGPSVIAGPIQRASRRRG